MENEIKRVKKVEGIRYELRAVKEDGNVIAKFTTFESADKAAGFASIIDDQVDKYIFDYINEEAETKKEMAAEAELQTELEAR